MAAVRGETGSSASWPLIGTIAISEPTAHSNIPVDVSVRDNRPWGRYLRQCIRRRGKHFPAAIDTLALCYLACAVCSSAVRTRTHQTGPTFFGGAVTTSCTSNSVHEYSSTGYIGCGLRRVARLWPWQCTAERACIGVSVTD